MAIASEVGGDWVPRTRRFVVAGSGPSLLTFDPRRVDRDATIIRVNNFFFEDVYRLGRRVDLVQVGGDRWVFPFYAATLRRLIAEDVYDVRGWSSHQPQVIRRGLKSVVLPFVPIRYRDREAEVAIGALVERYGKIPTTGILAIINAHGLEAETITLVGIDLYATPHRYAHSLGGHSAALIQQIGTSGYNNRFHDRALDRAILSYLLERGDVRIERTSPDGGALHFLPLARQRDNGFFAERKTVVINDWDRWAGLWPIEAMRLARRANEIRRSMLAFKRAGR